MAKVSGRRYVNEDFARAIPGSGGIITTIARRVGCDWHTAASRIAASPVLSQMFEDEANVVDDLAESVLVKSMQDGDVGSAKWWLERRRRGKYATRQETELTGAAGGPLVIQMTWGDSDDGQS